MTANITVRATEFINSQFSKRAKHELELKDKKFLIDYVLTKKAWRDATIRERFQKTSNIMVHKHEIIKILKNEITNNIDGICYDFDNWHKSICRIDDYDMRYGVWQKFINMTFKYLYCMKDLFPEFRSVWSKCHCPIDSIIAKRLNEQLKQIGASESDLELSYQIAHSGKTNWNSINEENYEKFQKQVQQVCAINCITPLEFDFVYWQN